MNADKFWKSKEVTILQPHDSFACFLVGLWGPICGIVDFFHSQNKYWHFGLVFQTNSQAHLPSCLYGHYLIVFFSGLQSQEWATSFKLCYYVDHHHESL